MEDRHQPSILPGFNMEAIPKDGGNKPVTCVSQEDARAYASCGRKTPGAQMEWHGAWTVEPIHGETRGMLTPFPPFRWLTKVELCQVRMRSTHILRVRARSGDGPSRKRVAVAGRIWDWCRWRIRAAATALGTHHETRKPAVAVSCWWKGRKLRKKLPIRLPMKSILAVILVILAVPERP
jgi:hypothetical protein